MSQKSKLSRSLSKRKTGRPSTTKRLLPRHIRAARLRVAGHSWTHIAETLGYSPSTVKGYPQVPGWDAECTRLVREAGRDWTVRSFVPLVERMEAILNRAPDSDGEVPEFRDAIKAGAVIAGLLKTSGLLNDVSNPDAPGTTAGGPGHLRISTTVAVVMGPSGPVERPSGVLVRSVVADGVVAPIASDDILDG